MFVVSLIYHHLALLLKIMSLTSKVKPTRADFMTLKSFFLVSLNGIAVKERALDVLQLIQFIP